MSSETTVGAVVDAETGEQSNVEGDLFLLKKGHFSQVCLSLTAS